MMKNIDWSCVKEVSEKEFRELYPDQSLYDYDWTSDHLLISGQILRGETWNGERYKDLEGHEWTPVQHYDADSDSYEIIGFEYHA